MKKSKFWLGFALVFMVFLAGVAAANKQLTDKQRIEVLEKQVAALDEAVSDQGADLAGAHQWAMGVNQRLQNLENRGPVARR